MALTPTALKSHGGTSDGKQTHTPTQAGLGFAWSSGLKGDWEEQGYREGNRKAEALEEGTHLGLVGFLEDVTWSWTWEGDEFAREHRTQRGRLVGGGGWPGARWLAGGTQDARVRGWVGGQGEAAWGSVWDGGSVLPSRHDPASVPGHPRDLYPALVHPLHPIHLPPPHPGHARPGG